MEAPDLVTGAINLFREFVEVPLPEAVQRTGLEPKKAATLPRPRLGLKIRKRISLQLPEVEVRLKAVVPQKDSMTKVRSLTMLAKITESRELPERLLRTRI